MMYDVVFIGAHPDDVVLACGGTVSKLSSLGYNCIILSLTAGENGNSDLGIIRKEELRQSAELMHCSFYVLNFTDTNITNTFYEQNVIKDLLSEWNPRFIFFHNPSDIHYDHAITSEIIKKSIALYLTSRHNDVPILKGYFIYQTIKINSETLLGNQFNYFCNITEYMEKKEKALNYHVSQLPYIMNNLEMIKLYNTLLGRIVGCKFAECFKYHELSYTNSMLPLENLFDWKEKDDGR